MDWFRDILVRMWVYLQRWQVVNALYHIRHSRGGVVWIQEHDLLAWIAGTDIRRHIGGDTWLTKARARLACLFFGVTTYDDLYTKIRNVIHSCESEEVHWIRRNSSAKNISDHLNLTTRGEEVYAYSHLIGQFFGNYYVKWIVTGLIVWFLANHVSSVSFKGF